MAFGLKPHYESTLRFENASPMQLLLAALEVANQLNWEIGKLSRTDITFYTGLSFWSYGEQIKFTLQAEHSDEVILSSSCISLQFFDWGRNHNNIKRLQHIMQEFLISTPQEEMEKMLQVLEENLQEIEENGMEGACLPEEKTSFFSLFLPNKRFFATPLLLDINVAVFIVMLLSGLSIFSPRVLDLMQWGANFGPLTLTGDWWRALTCNFVHFGIIHIVMNMYALLFIGLYLEPLIGKRRMLIAYLLTGACSAISSLFMHPETASVGASGSIFGFYGIFLAYLFFHRIERAQRRALLTSIGIFVAYNLLNGMGKAGIDNAAHVGGLASGFLLGLFYVLADRQQDRALKNPYSLIGEGALLLIFILSLAERTHQAPSDYTVLREVWNNGMLEKFINGEISEEEMEASVADNPAIAELQLPAYNPMKDTDTWISYKNDDIGFVCRYPTNWEKMKDGYYDFFKLNNGVSQMTVVCQTTGSKEEFERIHNMIPIIPRNELGEPSEDYVHEKVTIGGLPMDKVTNMQHFEVEGSDGFDVSQSVLYYFDKPNLRYFVVVMIAEDEMAKEELDGIAASIGFK